MNTDSYVTWKDYFDAKFNDGEFIVEDKTDSEDGVYYISSIVSSCQIYIIWPNDNWTQIEDVQFYSSLTKAWSGESIGPNPRESGKLTQENVEKIDQFLEIPLSLGWTAVEYYFAGKLLKVKSYEGKGQEEQILTDFTGDIGCLSRLIFWPILMIIEALVSKGVIGKKRIVYVEPMKKQKSKITIE